MKQLTCCGCGRGFLWPRKRKFCTVECRQDATNRRRRKGKPKPSPGLKLLKENRQLVLEGLKRCSGCREVKSLDSYYGDSKGLGGKRSLCSPCTDGRVEEYRGTEAAREKRIKAKERLRRQAGARPRSQLSEEAAARAEIRQKAKLISAAIRKAQREVKRKRKPKPPSPAKRWRERYRNDPEFQLKERMRRQLTKAAKRDGVGELIRAAIRRGGKSNRVEQLLGYSIAELKVHIERQFTRGMSWDHWLRGEIHLDHIVPQKAFDLSDDDEWRQCWSLSNLQPLWAEENLKKSCASVKLL